LTVDLPRFRRTYSPIEVYGQDMALAAVLVLLFEIEEGMGPWIGQSASPSRMASELFEGWRVFIVGVLVAVTLLFAARPLLPERGVARWFALLALVLAASTVGYSAWSFWRKFACGCDPLSMYIEIQFRHQVFVTVAVIAGIREFLHVSRRADEELHAARLQRVELDGQMAAGRLQVLLAQIEPHFLFNSLANLRRLLRTDGNAGQAMLADLLRYLEVALPRMRAEHSTLGRETELVRAFLAVHQVRMGARLMVDVDVPLALGLLQMPPMMLLTLVENSLKHGLNRLPEGGLIRVAASASAGRLMVSVADTGRGLVPGSGGGTGLANIRGRLRAAYGNAASLTLQLNQPRGVVATIVLPEVAS
jgi:hypothetical protein